MIQSKLWSKTSQTISKRCWHMTESQKGRRPYPSWSSWRIGSPTLRSAGASQRKAPAGLSTEEKGKNQKPGQGGGGGGGDGKFWVWESSTAAWESIEVTLIYCGKWCVKEITLILMRMGWRQQHGSWGDQLGDLHVTHVSTAEGKLRLKRQPRREGGDQDKPAERRGDGRWAGQGPGEARSPAPVKHEKRERWV